MSLYNDERPKRFSAVLGQELIVRQMKKKIAEGRFPHTALLTGPRGTGKTTCAGIIGKALNCEDLGADGEPCCRCGSCRSIEKGISPAVHELDAATHNGVDDVRALIEQSQFAPSGKKKVFILDEVHMFSTAAWNALLKILEEPPEDVVFILATTEVHKVPLTVLSRALKFEFRKIRQEVMQNYIYDLCVKYKIGIEPGALSLVVTSAEGCMRDALSLLEQFIDCEELETETVREFLGITSEEAVFDVLESIRDGKGAEAVRVVDECEQQGKNMLLVIKAILEALSYAMAYKATGKLPDQAEIYCERLKGFADSVSESKIGQFCDAFLQVYPLLAKNAQLTFFLRAAVMNLIGSESLLCRLEKEVVCLKGNGISVNQAAETVPEVIEEAASVPIPNEDSLNVPDKESPQEKESDGADLGEVPGENTFDSVPSFSDYSIESEESDTDNMQGEPIGDRDMDVPQDAGEEIEETFADNEEIDYEAAVREEETQTVQNNRVIDVDELFRMAEAACGGPASGDPSADNIVCFKSKGKEEPVGREYVAEKDDDPFAAFDFYMAGGSARRRC